MAVAITCKIARAELQSQRSKRSDRIESQAGVEKLVGLELSGHRHELMDEKVPALVGAERYERSEERATQRTGVRHRQWNTRVGTIELAIPKLRQGSYFPGWLEPRRRSEQALVGVVAEAYGRGKLVISDAQPGLKHAIAEVAWARAGTDVEFTFCVICRCEYRGVHRRWWRRRYVRASSRAVGRRPRANCGRSAQRCGLGPEGGRVAGVRRGGGAGLLRLLGRGLAPALQH